MSTVSPRGRSRTWPRGPLCLLALTLTLAPAFSGCGVTRNDASGRTQQADALVAGATSENGLLYPPDLWTAIVPSPAATAWRVATQRSLDRPAEWPYPAGETLALLTDEQGPQLGAWTMARALPELATELAAVCDDLPAWQRDGVATQDVDVVWHTALVGRAAGCPVAVDAVARTFLTRVAEEGPVVAGSRAADVLGGQPAPVVRETGNQLRSVSDIAPYLRLRRGLGMDLTGDTDLRRSAEAHARQDDETLLELVQLAMEGGERAEAERLVSLADARVQPDGRVTEAPLFQGTLGSTLKLLDYYRATGTLEQVSGQRRATLLAAIQSSTRESPIHEVAAAAAEEILQPDSVPSDRQQVLLAAAAQELRVTGQLLRTVEESIAWADLAGYAQAMGAPLTFPGLGSEAVDAWRAVPLDTAVPVLSRVVIRAARAGGAGDPGVQALAQDLAGATRGDSMTIVPAALAVYLARGTWMVPSSDLIDLLDRRQGECLGGADGFVREEDAPRTPCFVEVSRYAAELSSLLPH
ncbi:MAG: hypothetical protein Q4F65_02290 [Propionibacteriaceae bacterium]|nr:hypothetical protein [Propionibacteriaceae bacterium]